MYCKNVLILDKKKRMQVCCCIELLSSICYLAYREDAAFEPRDSRVGHLRMMYGRGGPHFVQRALPTNINLTSATYWTTELKQF